MKIKGGFIVLIIMLVIASSNNAIADECAANIKVGYCTHGNGKGKHACEDIWELDKLHSDPANKNYNYTHCKWYPGATQALGLCVTTGYTCHSPWTK